MSTNFSSSSTSSYSSSNLHSGFHASLFCTVIHLFLSCGRLSRAVDAFASMRWTYGLVPPGLSYWNRLIREFNASGLVSQRGSC
ncbi:hypothetical protein LOK49_LG02G02180 [Camellia lanceoleosa]|uniref:Uncharacterized protein n=1 Tax=Camellia lanceoleosa TaxID=1840588 RepID=A0ACC0IH31_9ERIC|nr:hypothetical protein LOK49_LG02G02180 [Camellia lanceoleosa]